MEPGPRRDSLILTHLGMSTKWARHYAGLGVDQEDLEAEGRLALVAAACAYDPAEYPGMRFAGFACKRVRAAMRAAISRCRPPGDRLPLDVEDLAVLPPEGTDEDAQAELVTQAVQALPEPCRSLISLMVGLDDAKPLGLYAAADRLHLSPNTARAIRDQAARKLGPWLRAQGWQLTPTGVA